MNIPIPILRGAEGSLPLAARAPNTAMDTGVIALGGEGSEYGHGYRGQGHYEEGIELLEYLGQQAYGLVTERTVAEDQGHYRGQGHETGYNLTALFLRLENGERRIYRNDYEYEVQHIGQNPGKSCHLGSRVVTGEEGQGETVLLEGHPEEDNHCEDEQQGHDTGLGLLLGELDDGLSALGLELALCDVGVLEALAEAEVDQDRENQ